MLLRREDQEAVVVLQSTFPVTAIIGARQVGKSTLARKLKFTTYFDLENPRDLARLDQPQLALEAAGDSVVIDEVQRKPDLFPLLRYMVDKYPERRYLILGSASRDLLRQSSETLAGRIAYHELGGFSFNDVQTTERNARRLWLRGGFPRAFLANDDTESYLWREHFMRTYLEQDIPQLGIRVPAATLRRFWTMIAHYHGQLVNFQDLSRSFGVSDATVRHYLEILEGTFMVRLLRPWYENIGKRLVRAPKLYLRDSGILHSLMGIPRWEALEAHPKLGASWEGFVLEQAIRHYRIREPYFYRTHAGAELDLFWEDGGKRYGMEIKYADAPRMTPSMRNAMEDLALDTLIVVYPGDDSYPIAPGIIATPFARLSDFSSSHA